MDLRAIPGIAAIRDQDPQAWLRSLQRLPATAAGGPVDLLNALAGMLGAPVSDRPVMGSQWLSEKLGMPAEPGSPIADYGLSMLAPAGMMGAGKALSATEAAIAREAANYRPKVGPAAQVGAIKPVYHGSPHRFDKFDMSKIGTGEGAQAYGHGLYFADSPEVASTYRSMTAPMPRLYDKRGNPFEAKTHAEMLAESRAVGAGGVEEAISRTARELQNKAQNGRGMAILEEVGRGPSEAEVLAALGKLRGYRRGPGGALYTAELEWPAAQLAAGKKPLSPDDLLDWDAPLSQQSPQVRSAIDRSAMGKDSLGWRGAPDGMYDRAMNLPSKTGEWFYRELADNNQRATSEMLRSLGIPGIRYLDGGSRGAGTGTRNYVIFDDALARILGRE